MRREQGIESVARIQCRIEDYDWAFAREQSDRIDAHWADQCRRKPSLFDGRVLLAHRLSVENDVLTGAYFETSYRSFLGWRDFGYPGAPIANCFAMAALRAADGAFMLGMMGSGTANGGRLYFPSGTPEPNDVGPDGWIAHEANMLRELEEETGLRPDEVELDDRWTIVSDGPAVACMRLVYTRDTAAQLEARLAAFNARHDDPELERLVPVRGPRDFDPARMPGFMIAYLAGALSGT